MSVKNRIRRLENYLASSQWDGSTAMPLLIELHPLQQEIADHPARFKVLACGRRVGKTELAKNILATATTDTDLPYAYFTPTYKMLRGVWESVKSMLYPVIQSVNEQEKRLTFLSGATVDFWSLHAPNGARGRKYAGVIIDEAAIIPVLEYAYNEVIRPTLTDLEGWGLFLATPKGRNHFWVLFQRGLDPLQPEWMAWQRPTSDNPYISPGEIEAARLELPERSFKQEYLAEFLEDSGLVFRGVGLVSTAKPAAPIKGHDYVFGVDWGKSNDFTVICVYDETAKTEVRLERFNQISWALQRGRLKALYDQYHPRVIMAELNSIGEPNIEALAAEGLPVKGFTMTAASKTALVDALALVIERQETTLLDDPVGTFELQSYEMEQLPSGLWRYRAPLGSHDDTVVARMLAHHARQSQPQVLTISPAPAFLTDWRG